MRSGASFRASRSSTGLEASVKQHVAAPPVASSTGGISSSHGGNAKSAEAKRRREDAELRFLIEQETDRCSVLHARINNVDLRISAATKDIERLLEDNALERQHLETELERWHARLDDQLEALRGKQEMLLLLQRDRDAVKRDQNRARMALVDWFVLRNDGRGEGDRSSPGNAADGDENDDLDSFGSDQGAGFRLRLRPTAAAANHSSLEGITPQDIFNQRNRGGGARFGEEDGGGVDEDDDGNDYGGGHSASIGGRLQPPQFVMGRPTHSASRVGVRGGIAGRRGAPYSEHDLDEIRLRIDDEREVYAAAAKAAVAAARREIDEALSAIEEEHHQHHRDRNGNVMVGDEPEDAQDDDNESDGGLGQ